MRRCRQGSNTTKHGLLIPDGAVRPLTVISWPYKASPGAVAVFKDSADSNTWLKAQIMFRNLDRHFLVMFRASGPSVGSHRMDIAVDDVHVVGGRCGRGRRRSGRILRRRRRSRL